MHSLFEAKGELPADAGDDASGDDGRCCIESERKDGPDGMICTDTGCHAGEVGWVFWGNVTVGQMSAAEVVWYSFGDETVKRCNGNDMLVRR